MDIIKQTHHKGSIISIGISIIALVISILSFSFDFLKMPFKVNEDLKIVTKCSYSKVDFGGTFYRNTPYSNENEAIEDYIEHNLSLDFDVCDVQYYIDLEISLYNNSDFPIAVSKIDIYSKSTQEILEKLDELNIPPEKGSISYIVNQLADINESEIFLLRNRAQLIGENTEELENFVIGPKEIKKFDVKFRINITEQENDFIISSLKQGMSFVNSLQQYNYGCKRTYCTTISTFSGNIFYHDFKFTL